MSRLIIFSLLSVFISCTHPESSMYKRNNGRSEKHQNNLENEENESLKLEVENGVKYIWIEMNGIKLRFIFDTGASSICISEVEAMMLYRQGTLNNDDIIENQYFQDATGNISEGTKINIREIKIGNYVLNNVEALVVNNPNAPLLLGQTVLERFGNIEIDNVNQEITFRN